MGVALKMLAMGRLLLLCLILVAPSQAQWKVFKASRTVTAKNKQFVCAYQLKYKGSLTVDTKKSRVTCKPDSKGKYGTVSETFVIGDKNVEVTHDVKKGKDTVKGIKISQITAAAPVTTTTASPVPSPSPTGGTGGGTGGTGGGTGGSGGGTGGTGGATGGTGGGT